MALDAHHAAARKIVLTVNQLLEQPESGRDTSLNLQSEISQHLNALAREVQALEDLLPERTPLRFLRRLQRIDIIAAHFHLLTRNLVKLSVRQVRVEPPGAAVPEPLTRREV